MNSLVKKLKPSRGYAHVFYVSLNVLLPLTVVVLVRGAFAWLAIALILLSKWRMFAVRPRFWGANIRANAIDIIVGLSVLGFMVTATTGWYQGIYAVLWILWLIILKPKSDVLSVSLQACIGFGAGLTAIFALWSTQSLIMLIFAVGFLSFFAAYHFFYSFDEPHRTLLAYLWAYFAAALTWILGHWLVFYWFIAQPTVILVSVGMVLGTLYYLDHFDRLTAVLRRQLVFIGIATLVIIWTALVYFHWLHGNTIIV